MRAAPRVPRRSGLLAEMGHTVGAEQKRSQIRVENITRRTFFARLDVAAARAMQRAKALEHTFQENCGTWWRERRGRASIGFGRRRSALPEAVKSDRFAQADEHVENLRFLSTSIRPLARVLRGAHDKPRRAQNGSVEASQRCAASEGVGGNV